MVISKGHPDRSIGGKLDDPVVIVAKLELAGRAHHAVALNAADRRFLQFKPACWHHRTGQAEYADQTGAGVGCAADHLQRFAAAGVDAQHLQLVGIGVGGGGQHLGDGEARQPVSRVLDTFDFKPDGVELGRDRFNRCFGIEVIFEPGQ